jgi:hypothetical protein
MDNNIVCSISVRERSPFERLLGSQVDKIVINLTSSTT